MQLLDQEGDLPEAPELCVVADIANSTAMTEVEGRWARAVLAKSSREVLWTERFQPLCAVSTRISIIDRYAADQVVQQILGGKPRRASGVEWFLRKVALTDVNTVRLVTEHPGDTAIPGRGVTAKPLPTPSRNWLGSPD